jgi:hypothetical protein
MVVAGNVLAADGHDVSGEVEGVDLAAPNPSRACKRRRRYG